MHIYQFFCSTLAIHQVWNPTRSCGSTSYSIEFVSADLAPIPGCLGRQNSFPQNAPAIECCKPAKTKCPTEQRTILNKSDPPLFVSPSVTGWRAWDYPLPVSFQDGKKIPENSVPYGTMPRPKLAPLAADNELNSISVDEMNGFFLALFVGGQM